jgi:4-amino-4-deoxy-L-arabinose transferase-like glycosyltransferase
LLPALFFPGSLALGAGVLYAMSGVRTAWNYRKNAAGEGATGNPQSLIHPGLFLVGWLVPSWIIFECVQTKLPHYTMPLYPALALLCAGGLATGGDALTAMVSRWWARLGHKVWMLALCALIMLFFGVLATALSAGPTGTGLALTVPETGAAASSATAPPIARLFAPSQLTFIGWMVFALGCGFALFVGSLAVCFRQRPDRSVLIGCGAFAIAACVLMTAAPMLSRLWTTRQIAGAIARIDPSGQRALGAVGYHEDSLIFATRGRVVRLDPQDLPGFLSTHPDALIIADDASGLPLTTAESITGFNYSKGRWTYISIGTVPTPR